VKSTIEVSFLKRFILKLADLQEIPFHKSCGGDDLCQSKLQASMEIVGQNHETGN